MTAKILTLTASLFFAAAYPYPVPPVPPAPLSPVAQAYRDGYRDGRVSVQDANDLLRVGFRIFDPEGFEIEKFD